MVFNSGKFDGKLDVLLLIAFVFQDKWKSWHLRRNITQMMERSDRNNLFLMEIWFKRYAKKIWEALSSERLRRYGSSKGNGGGGGGGRN